MTMVNRDWLNSRKGEPGKRYRFRMGDKKRSRFAAGAEYEEVWCIAHGLVDAGLAVFVDAEDNAEATVPRARTMKELQNLASLYNLPVFDTAHKRDRTHAELTADIAFVEDLAQTLMQLKVSELKTVARNEDLGTGGKKAEIVARIVAHRAAEL